MKSNEAYELFNQRLNVHSINLNRKHAEKLFNYFFKTPDINFYAEMESIILAISSCLERVKEVNEAFFVYVLSYYKSLSPLRLSNLMAKNKSYQTFENELFKNSKIIKQNGFNKCIEKHNKLIKALENKYHELLYDGEIVNTDEKMVEKVIEPVITKHLENISSIIKDDSW